MQATTQHTNGNTSNNNTSGKARKPREVVPMTPVLAITKVGKILDQLSAADRRRVLAFLNEPNNE